MATLQVPLCRERLAVQPSRSRFTSLPQGGPRVRQESSTAAEGSPSTTGP